MPEQLSETGFHIIIKSYRSLLEGKRKRDRSASMLIYTECENRKITELNAEKKSGKKCSVKKGRKECVLFSEIEAQTYRTNVDNKGGKVGWDGLGHWD